MQTTSIRESWATRTTRTRWPVTALATLLAVLVLAASAIAAVPTTTPTIGETLGTGGMRSGPLGLNPPASNGVLPTRIQIERAGVDAEVEHIDIVDGVMLDPTGPWVVSWYRQTARPGAPSNSVMSGHKDYWDVGPAVFYTVTNLVQGDEIVVTGQNGAVLRYSVEWVQTYNIATITSEQIQEIVGPTDVESLTLITCGGEFDYATGEYLSRDIVRATRVTDVASVTPDTPDVDADEVDTEPTDTDTAPGGITDTSEDDPAPVGIQEGAVVVVTESAVNLRASASTEADVVAVLDQGTEMTITGPSESAYGFVWWPIATADGTTGFIAEDFIAAQ